MDPIVVGKPNLNITEIWAIIATDENGEGIMGGMVDTPQGLMMMPFVGADKNRVLSLLPKAAEIAGYSGTQIKVCKFTNKTDVTAEFFPKVPV